MRQRIFDYPPDKQAKAERVLVKVKARHLVQKSNHKLTRAHRGGVTQCGGFGHEKHTRQGILQRPAAKEQVEELKKHLAQFGFDWPEMETAEA